MALKRMKYSLTTNRIALKTIVLTLISSLLICLGSCTTDDDTRIGYEYITPTERGDGWSVATLSEVGIDEGPIVELTNKILADEYTDIHSMLIVRNGKLAYEAYFNGFSANAFHTCFSYTKSFSSTLIGLAIGQNLIPGVNEPIINYFPGKEALFTDGKEAITIENMLTMSAGLEWDEWTTSSLSPENSHEQMMRADSQIDHVLGLPLVNDPGTTFTYSTGLSNLMAPIIEQVSGTTVETFAEQHLLNPLGITNYRWNTVIDDFPSTGGSRGGLEMVPRDMAKLGQLFLDGGQWNGQQIISQDWTQEALTPRIQESQNINYGYQWWNRTYFRKDGEPVLEYDAVGDGGQWVIIFPELDLLVAFTGGNYTWLKESTLMFQPVNMVQQFILPAVD